MNFFSLSISTRDITDIRLPVPVLIKTKYNISDQSTVWPDRYQISGCFIQGAIEKKRLQLHRAVDPHSLYTDPDPDPAVFLNADPDPDPDLDPDPGPGLA